MRAAVYGQVVLLITHTGAYNTKTFEISENLGPLLIHNEEEAHVAGFTCHAMSFKFPIISGEQPTSHLAYQMKNWTGYLRITSRGYR